MRETVFSASELKRLDWIDIAIHVGLAVVGMALLHLVGVPAFFLLVFNALFWPARELYQHRPDYLEIITHPQSLLEWLAPTLAGLAVFGVLA